MLPLIRRLAAGYRAYHETNKSLLEWIGVVGAIGLPLLYVLRFTGKLPPLYDDLPFRLVATVSCLLTALRRWWPERLQRYYDGFSYWTVFYSLAFMLPFTMLHNRGATPSVVNMVVSVVFVVLLTDWRNTIAMLVGGYSAALGAYWLTAPHPQLPVDFMLWWGPVCAVLVAAGSIGKHVEKQAELARMRRLYAGLAGSIAHEVRSPLLQVNHVLDAIEAALKDGPAGRTVSAEERFAALRQAVGQGRGAVSRGLQAISVTLQQLNPGAFEPARFRVLSAAQCVRKAAAEYAYDDEAQRARVVVDVRGDFTFRGEETVLVLVLFNLVKNALYYLPVRPDAVVTITVDGAGRRIEVHDTGPGIAPELLPRLFEEFQSAGKAEGTGLGLAFCKRAMQAFGGRIACDSEVGRFTRFTLTFPEIPAGDALPQPAAGSAAAAANLIAGRTVLVVDDHALNRTAARAHLTVLDAHVLEAEHGEQALQLLRTGAARPDAVLMDINMPGLDGIQTTRALRTLPGPVGRVPVVAVTANDSAQVREAAAAAGMQAVLAKPLDADVLLDTLGPLIASETAPQPHPAPRAPVPSPAALLDTERIDDFRRMGLMDELLPESLTGMRRLVQDLHDCTTNGQADGARSALHTLVGLSGETGARALHALLRRRYGEVLEGRGPQGAAWLEEVRLLLASTEQALQQQYGVVPAVPAQTSSHSLRV